MKDDNIKACRAENKINKASQIKKLGVEFSI
jgi:hypothetical protein